MYQNRSKSVNKQIIAYFCGIICVLFGNGILCYIWPSIIVQMYILSGITIVGLVVAIIITYDTFAKDLNHWCEQILDFVYLPMSITDTSMDWTFINKPVKDIIRLTRKEAIGEQCSNWNADICNTERCGIMMLRKGEGTSFFTNEGIDRNFQVDTTYLYDRKKNKIGHLELVSDITAKVKLETAVDQLRKYSNIKSPLSSDKDIQKKEPIIVDGIDNSHMRQYTVLEDSISSEELFNLTMSANVANKAKSDFLATMSHEIRTPMNAILGFTEILKGSVSNPKHLKYLNSIHISGNSLLSLINGILDLSKVEAGEMVLHSTASSLPALLEEIGVIFSQRIEEKDLDFTVTIPDEFPRSILFDQLRLRQILINLVGNAIKFTDSGGIAIVVSYSESSNTPDRSINCTISIEDTGIGIPNDKCKSIFDAFSQVMNQETTQYGGTGLGLSISKKLMELMSGDISVESTLGIGSTFVLELPDLDVALELFDENHSSQTIDCENIIFDPCTILITDDIEINRVLLKNYLEHESFTCLEAVNGQDSIEKAFKHLPDMILMDMKMPIMNGYEATRIIKNDSDLKHIPIVAVTASALVQDEETIKHICNDYLKKPLTKIELYQTLKKFLPYKELTTKASLNDNIQQPIEKKPMMPPPSIELNRLYKAALQGDMQELLNSAQSVESEYPQCISFVHTIRSLANEYKDDQLLDFIEPFLENVDE